MALERGSFIVGKDPGKTLKRVSGEMIKLDEDMRNTYAKVAGETDLKVVICGHNPGSEQSWRTGPGPVSSAVPKGQAEEDYSE